MASLERKQRARQKVDGHDQEVHDELKSLHVLQARADGHAERRKDNGDEHHEAEGDGNRSEMRGPEAGDQANDRDQQALDARRPSRRPACGRS